MQDTKNYINIIIQEVKNCFLDKSESYQLSTKQLDKIVEFIKELKAKSSV